MEARRRGARANAYAQLAAKTQLDCKRAAQRGEELEAGEAMERRGFVGEVLQYAQRVGGNFQDSLVTPSWDE